MQFYQEGFAGKVLVQGEGDRSYRKVRYRVRLCFNLKELHLNITDNLYLFLSAEGAALDGNGGSGLRRNDNCFWWNWEILAFARIEAPKSTRKYS